MRILRVSLLSTCLWCASFAQSVFPPAGGVGVGAANVQASAAGPATSLAINITSLSLTATTLNSLVIQCWSGTGIDGNGPTGTLTPVTVTSITPRSTTSATANFSSSSNVGCVANSNGGAGAPGGNGSNGANGATWSQGSGVPSDGSGNNGDFYFRTATSDVYQKASGTWGSPIANLKGSTGSTGAAGSNGSNGNTVLTTSGAPSSGTGANGDFAYDATAKIMYGPKAGSWPGGVSLSGSNGSNGTNGAAGSFTVPNDGGTGTTLQQLAKINSSGNAVNAGTGDTAIPVFIVNGGAGTTGSATMAIGGLIACKTDAGGATVGHFIVASTATAGRCMDTGSASPPTSGWVVGIAQTPAAANANTNVAVIQGYNSASSGGSAFTGSTAVTSAFSATPTFSLADVSIKSPVIFQPGIMSANVTAVAFTNPTPGAEFSILWPQAASGGPYTVVYGASVSSTYPTCQVTPTAGGWTLQSLKVLADGTTIIGTGCTGSDPGISVAGAVSGQVQIEAPAMAGNNVLTLPAGTTDFSATGGAHQVVKQSSLGGALTVGQLACGDLSDSAAGCSGGGGAGTVVPKSISYTLVQADGGSVITFNNASLTATLPATPPAMPWIVGLKNMNASDLTVARNGNTINGGTSNITLHQYQEITCASDTATGGEYKCTTPVTATSPITLTQTSNAQTATCGTCIVASSPSAGILHVAGGTQTATSSLVVPADLAPADFTTGTSKTFSLVSQYFECTGTCTITMPVPAPGTQYCVRNANNVATVITFAAIGSSARYENTASTAYGTAGTGTLISSGAVGDKMCLVGKDSTHYDVFSFNGTWTAN